MLPTHAPFSISFVRPPSRNSIALINRGCAVTLAGTMWTHAEFVARLATVVLTQWSPEVLERMHQYTIWWTYTAAVGAF